MNPPSPDPSSVPPPLPPPVPPPVPPRPASRPEDDPGMRLLMPIGRSGWAIAAGYLGLVSVLLVPAPFALGCGVMALRHIAASKGSPRPLHGRGRAIFGIIAGSVGTAVLLTSIVGYLRRGH